MSEVAYISRSRIERKKGPLHIAYVSTARLVEFSPRSAGQSSLDADIPRAYMICQRFIPSGVLWRSSCPAMSFTAKIARSRLKSS